MKLYQTLTLARVVSCGLKKETDVCGSTKSPASVESVVRGDRGGESFGVEYYALKGGGDA